MTRSLQHQDRCARARCAQEEFLLLGWRRQLWPVWSRSLANWRTLQISRSERRGLQRGILHNMTTGLNWFWNPNSKFQFNYITTYRDVSDTTNFPTAAAGSTDFGTRLGHRFLGHSTRGLLAPQPPGATIASASPCVIDRLRDLRLFECDHWARSLRWSRDRSKFPSRTSAAIHTG